MLVQLMLRESHRLCRYIDSRRFHRHARFLALSAYEVGRLRMLSGWSNDNGLARRRSLDLDLKNTMLHKTGIYYASRGRHRSISNFSGKLVVMLS